ncbi:MAG: hypothetical protein MUC96_15090 [Myxococcaceae bacterium]|jgi:hypothetical protein|nr:hypothetical protein [Myxococcaceae bacterium]
MGMNSVRADTYAFRALYVERGNTFESTLKSKLKISGLNVGKVTLTPSASITAQQQRSSRERSLVLVAVVHTKTESLVPPGNATMQCTQGSLAQFWDTCGEQWLSERKYGGIIVAVVDESSLTQNSRLELEAGLGVGLGGKTLVEANQAAAVLSKAEVANINYFVYNFGGLPPPPSGTLTSAALNKYVERMAKETGTIYEQTFTDMTMQQINQCITEDLSAAELECHRAYTKHGSDIVSSTGKYGARATEQQYWLQNQNTFVIVDPNPTSVWARHQKSLDDVQACSDAYLTATACSTATATSLCSACTVPDSDRCSSDVLDRTVLEPEKPQEVPPIGPVRTSQTRRLTTLKHNDPDVFIGSLTDDVCLLSGLSGSFQGGGEKAIVSRDTTFNNWRLQANSLVTNPHTKGGRALGQCAPRTNFGYNMGTGTWLPDHYGSFTHTNGLPVTFSFATQSHAVGIAGMAGAFWNPYSGSSPDMVSTNEGQGALVRLTAGSGFVAADALGFGLTPLVGMTPKLTDKQFANSTEAANKNKALRLREQDGFCFLTNVSGEFKSWYSNAEIRQVGDFLILEVDEDCDRGFLGICTRHHQIYAEARCYLYDQGL